MDNFALVETLYALPGVLLRVDVSPWFDRFLQSTVLTLNKFILHREFVLLSHASVHTEILHSELDVFDLLETIRRGDFVIKIDFLFVEDKDISACYHVAFGSVK